MSRDAVITAVADLLSKSKKETESLINTVFEAIADEVVAGNEVKITDFGIFGSKTSEAREGRNPRTQETIVIPAKTKVVFRPSKAFTEKVNEKR